jgi:hypothetical protein
MTHTLHRRGNSESLSKDYVVFAIAAQTVNAKGSAPLFKKFADVVQKFNPVNFGDMKTGNKFGVGLEQINGNYRDNSIVHAVFTDEETVVKVLKELKEADTGLSIVVSGLLEHTARCCSGAGLTPHTVNQSLGIMGRTDYLPSEEIVQIGTMCGHGMVSFALIEKLAGRVAKGTMKAEAAAQELARMCHCGVFNPERAVSIIQKMAKE